MRHWLKSMSGALCIGACALSVASIPSTVQAKARTVQVVIRDDGFTPNQILGVIHQPIHLKIQNAGHKIHEFAIPEYRVYTRNLEPGETSDIQFAPWQAGSFVMYSDPAADSHPEFSGRFIVVDEK